MVSAASSSRCPTHRATGFPSLMESTRRLHHCASAGVRSRSTRPAVVVVPMMAPTSDRSPRLGGSTELRCHSAPLPVCRAHGTVQLIPVAYLYTLCCSIRRRNGPSRPVTGGGVHHCRCRRAVRSRRRAGCRSSPGGRAGGGASCCVGRSLRSPWSSSFISGGRALFAPAEPQSACEIDGSPAVKEGGEERWCVRGPSRLERVERRTTDRTPWGTPP